MNAAVLLVMASRHYGYYHVPAGVMGDVFSLCGSAALIVLLIASDVWLPLKGWALYEETLVSVCTGAWLVSPWQFADERCSAQVGIKLGVFGLVALALVVWRLTVKVDSIAEDKKAEQ